jgi:hypothetical protein
VGTKEGGGVNAERLKQVLSEYLGREIKECKIVNRKPLVLEYKEKIDPIYYYVLEEPEESGTIVFDDAKEEE